MRFAAEGSGMTRGARHVSLGLIGAAIGVVLILASAQVSHAQNGVTQQYTINNDLNKIVYPMLISVIGVNITGTGAQQTVTIGLSAGNNLAIEPNYADATANLESLSLVLTCSSPSENIPQTVVNLTPTTRLTLTANHNETVSVSSGLTSIPVGALMSCTIEGSYTWQLHATVTDSSGTYDRLVNGKGTIQQFTQQVTAQ
jgi:hypothetical protein